MPPCRVPVTHPVCLPPLLHSSHHHHHHHYCGLRDHLLRCAVLRNHWRQFAKSPDLSTKSALLEPERRTEALKQSSDRPTSAAQIGNIGRIKRKGWQAKSCRQKILRQIPCRRTLCTACTGWMWPEGSCDSLWDSDCTPLGTGQGKENFLTKRNYFFGKKIENLLLCKQKPNMFESLRGYTNVYRSVNTKGNISIQLQWRVYRNIIEVVSHIHAYNVFQWWDISISMSD